MLFYFIAIVSLGVMVNAQIDYKNCTTFAAAVTKCGTDYPLVGVNAVELATAQNIWAVTNLETYCNATNKVNFGKQTKCVIEAYRACAATDAIKTLIPAPSKYEEGVNTLCASAADFNINCGSGLGLCVGNKLQAANLTEPQGSVNFAALKPFVCLATEGYLQCVDADADDALTGCAKNKTQSTLKSIFPLLKPTACDDDGGSGDDENGAAEFFITSVLLISSIFISMLI